MKKIKNIMLVVILAFSVIGCGSVSQESNAVINEPETTEMMSTEMEISETTETVKEDSIKNGKALVVYFSVPETTDLENRSTEEENSVVEIEGEVLGNTQYVAYVIQEHTGADIFRIEPKEAYTTDHEKLVEIAKEEQNNQTRPALNANLENLEQYDTVFVGYPNWWGDMPMILYTFFENYDFSDKTMIPFNTHGGSGFSDTISTIAKLEPEATVSKDGFSVSRDLVQNAEQDIVTWLAGLGY